MLVSTALRAAASLRVVTPWIAPDELLYGLLGQGLYRHGSLTVLGGPTPYYSLVVPALVGAPLSLHDLALGYALLKPLEAFVMSLAAIPVYLWARSLMSRRAALLAAVLTLALPALAYSGLVMSEVVYYPVFTLAVWATASVVRAPSLRHQLLFVLAALLALATRLQSVVLVPILLTSLLLAAAFSRRRPRPLALAPVWGACLLAGAAWLAWRLGEGTSVLAGYSGANGAYPVGLAAKFVAWHAGDLVLLCGVLPAAALLVLLARAVREGERDPAVAAYLAVAASVVVWLVVEVGVFASQASGTLLERNLIVVAPVLFVAFAWWLDRGAPGSLRLRAGAGFVAAAAVAAVPLGRFVTSAGLPSAFTLIPLYHLLELNSLGVLQLTVGLGLAAAVLLFVFARGRGLAAMAAVVLAALVAASVSASREVVDQSRAQQLRLLGPVRRWVDDAAPGGVAYVYDGQAWWNAPWENVFWNRSIDWVYDLPDTSIPGPLPQAPLTVSPDGALRPNGEASPARFGVVPLDIALRGSLIASAPQLGTDRQGLGLWRLQRPLRLSTITSGLFANGDVDGTAALAVYGCSAGSFEAVFLVKQPETVTVTIDGRRVARKRFPFATTWSVDFPVAPTAAGPNRICRLLVTSDGLLGSTRFAFARG